MTIKFTKELNELTQLTDMYVCSFLPYVTENSLRIEPMDYICLPEFLYLFITYDIKPMNVFINDNVNINIFVF